MIRGFRKPFIYLHQKDPLVYYPFFPLSLIHWLKVSLAPSRVLTTPVWHPLPYSNWTSSIPKPEGRGIRKIRNGFFGMWKPERRDIRKISKGFFDMSSPFPNTPRVLNICLDTLEMSVSVTNSAKKIPKKWSINIFI